MAAEGRPRFRSWPFFLAAAAVVQAAAALPAAFETPRIELRHCLERHAGAERIDLALQCPGLARALQAEESTMYLPPVGDTPRRATLENLQRLLRAASGSGDDAASLDYASLDGILAEVHRPVTPPPPGLWERFLRWLGGLLDDGAESSYLEPLKRFFEWIEQHVPVGRIAELLFQGTLIALFILAIGLLAHQLAGARGWPRWSRRPARFVTGGDTAASAAALSLAELRRLPPAGQPAALLRLCIDVLVRRNILPAGRGRTNRELLRCLDREPGVRGAFAGLVETAEPCIYGGRPVEAGRLDALYEQAAALLGERNRPA